MCQRTSFRKALPLLAISVGIATPAAGFFNVLLLKKPATSCDTSYSGFVQGNSYNTGWSAGTTTFVNNYIGPQTAGNLNAVAIQLSGTTNTVSSVTDSAGNTYTKAIGPVRGSTATVYIYYAKNIASSAAGNEVTVTTGSNTSYVWIDLSEYRGLDTTSPVDGTPASGSGSTTAVATGSVTTTHACDVLYSATVTDGVVTATGTNYRMRNQGWGNVVEDRVVSTTGSYTGTMTQQSTDPYVSALVAFKKNSGTIAQNSIRKVQWNSREPANWVTSQTINFLSAQTAGNLNVVSITSYDEYLSVTSVTDTAGNTYTKASGPIALGANEPTAYVYYAKNIAASAAGANVVTVNLSATTQISTTVVEYQGLSTTSPLDKVASATSNGNANLNSGSVTTTSANELILGIFKTGNHGYEQPEAGSGFMPAANEVLQSSTFIEEKVVSSTGTYSATAACWGACHWIAHIVTFK
jgi:hypothetical protein